MGNAAFTRHHVAAARPPRSAVTATSRRGGLRSVVLARIPMPVPMPMTGQRVPEGVGRSRAPADFLRLIAEHDTAGIKAVADFALATTKQRLQMVDILLPPWSWIGPLDESAIERIYASFGPEGIAAAHDANPELWERAVAKGAELDDLPAVAALRARFESDVKALAHAYMQRNRQAVTDEAGRLGLGDLGTEASPSLMPDRGAVAQVQNVAREVQRADDVIAGLRSLPVGYNWATIDLPGMGMRSDRSVATYSPEARPMQRPTGAERLGFADWDEVDRHYRAVATVRARLASRDPAVFAAVAAGPGEAGRLAAMTPEAAAGRLRELLGATLRSIDTTDPMLDAGALDWRDLVPLHDQLFGGLLAESGTEWGRAFNTRIARDVIADHQSQQFWLTLGLGSLAAAAFIFSEIATSGMATFLWAAAGVTASGSQAAMSIARYQHLVTAAGAATSEDTRLVGGQQVSDAAFAAVLDTAFAFLDVFAAARGVASAVRATAARQALERLGELGAAESRVAVEQAVRDLGARETIRRTGRSPEELALLVGENSEAGRALRAAEGSHTVESALATGTAAAPVTITPEAQRLAARVQGVFARWGKLTRNERIDALVQAVNQDLQRIGAPPLDPIVYLKAPAETRGLLNHRKWELAIADHLLSGPTITPEEFSRLVGTVAHEGRHAEQWFRAAQLEAAAGRNATQIAEGLKIYDDVAQAAFEVQRGERAGERLAGKAALAEAEVFWNTLRAGARVRGNTFRELRDSGAALKTATTDYRAARSLTATDARLQAAEAAFVKAQRRQAAAEAAYRALPEEADAFRVGDVAAAAMRERFGLASQLVAAQRAERAAFAAYSPLEELLMSVVGRPSMTLSYDSWLAYYQALDRWLETLAAVDELKAVLSGLGRGEQAVP
jgi:hypothetical protein